MLRQSLFWELWGAVFSLWSASIPKSAVGLIRLRETPTMTRSFSRKNWKRAKAWTARRTSRVTGPTKNTLIDRLESFSRPHSSTVALIPPEDAWTSLQRTRELLSDKGIYRWPPHINLLCESRSRRVFSLVSLVQSLASLRVDPFLPPQVFSEAVQLLAPAAASVKPFEVTLDALGVFGGKRRGVLYAYSSDPDQTRALIELQATLQASTAPPRPNPLRTDPCH
mmetsp:Transcript_43211/g.97666  ORF Transcript_43211/g.97666 Transcript_43211/m.97666 type:complete len:224 (+) Transcript_43211:110-781(+)